MMQKSMRAIFLSALLAGAASAQEASSAIADPFEPEIAIQEAESIEDLLSVADYESGQTGGVVDPRAAADAMIQSRKADAPKDGATETVSALLLPAEALDGVPMDSDEVDFAETSEAVSNILAEAGVEIANE